MHFDRFPVSLRKTNRHLASHPADRLFQKAHARFARVAADDLLERRIGQDELLRRQTGLLKLPRHDVALGDLDLFLVAVAGEPEDFQAIEQGARDRVQAICRRDEEDLRQIERKIEVVVAERMVLSRVEDFQKRCRRIAAIIVAELVHLVEHHHRIVDTGSAQRLQNPARHGADIRAAVATQLRLVVHAAETDAFEFASHRPRDRLSERRLANSRWADEAQDRRLGLRIQLEHCEVLQDALLDFFEIVVILIQHLMCVAQVEIVLRRILPG